MVRKDGISGAFSGAMLRRFGFAAIVTLGCLGASSAMARDHGGGPPGNDYTVDHNGIYLTQQIGRCLNGTGPCYYGGQCPGGEATTSAYGTGRVYCRSFYPDHPYPPTFFESLFTGRR